MAALEAAAEAVVAAEAAADSADHAEAAADVAETAAELVVGRNSAEDSTLDPEAQAALDARVDAGGFEESYTDRLASLLPTRRDAAADGEPRTTQVVVSGLVSVASIASFKRHLGRLAGVHVRRRGLRPRGRVRVQRHPPPRRLVPRRASRRCRASPPASPAPPTA